MTDGPNETLRPVPGGKMWIGRPGGEWSESFAVLGHTADDALRRRDELRMPFSVTMRLEPCLLCRATLVIVNGKIKGPASFRLDDGDVVITPHADACYGEHGR